MDNINRQDIGHMFDVYNSTVTYILLQVCHRVTSVPRLNPSDIRQGLNINIMYVYMNRFDYSYSGRIH